MNPRVELWEDNGGGLYAICEGLVHSGIEYVGSARFGEEAPMIADGDTKDWSLLVTPESEWNGRGCNLIAVYEDGEVRRTNSPIGVAGEIYLGLADG